MYSVFNLHCFHRSHSLHRLHCLSCWNSGWHAFIYCYMIRRAIHGKKAIRGKRGMGGWLVRLLEHLSLLLYDCQSHPSTMTLLEVLHSSQTVNIVTKSLSLWLSMSIWMSPSLSFFLSCIFVGHDSSSFWSTVGKVTSFLTMLLWSQKSLCEWRNAKITYYF